MRRVLTAEEDGRADGQAVEIVNLVWVRPDGDGWSTVEQESTPDDAAAADLEVRNRGDRRHGGDYVFSVPIQGGPYGMTL